MKKHVGVSSCTGGRCSSTRWLRTIGAAAAAEVRAGTERRTQPAVAEVRAFIAMRSRYAEHSAARAALRQHVVVGAGLDTLACRTIDRGLAVFEVDHPATKE
jgi:methyltransferase (TIGR00027 family)